MRNPFPLASLRTIMTGPRRHGLFAPVPAMLVPVAAIGVALYLLSAGQVAGFLVLVLVACLALVLLFAAGQGTGLALGAHKPGGLAGVDDLLETIMGAMVRYAPDGTPLYISPTAGDLLGCRRFELSGDGLFERVHIMDRPAYRKAVRDVALTHRPQTVEVRMRQDAAQAGMAPRYLWIELSLATMEGGAGPEGQGEVLALLRDIGARKQAEEDLQNARAEAEAASEAKSRFLATVGHELRTPLNAIVGFSDMMAEGIGGTLSETHADYAGHIRQSGHHLLDIVNMLLDMSRIEAGKFELQAEAFSPSALVEPCLQMVEKLGRDRDIALDTHVSEKLPQIMGDERACRQIVINLLSNAIKFSHPGARVGLAIKRQGKMLSIMVSDTGIGMPPEIIGRIGEPFLQAQDGLSRRYEGTGLGLSIVKGLVVLHGGKLTVHSDPGVGTTVTVLLPLDGPAPQKPTARIERLQSEKRDSDEVKWLVDEKRSAAR